MARPTEWFVRALENLDPLLRVRWGGVVGKWVIERKAVVPGHEVQYLIRRRDRLARFLSALSESDLQLAKNKELLATYQGVSEELAAARDGHRVVFMPTLLNQSAYDALVASDITRFGGYSRFADELERAEAAEAARVEKDRAAAWDNIHRETYDVINFLDRKRATQMAHGERDLNKLLHGEVRPTRAIDIDITAP